MTRAQEDSITNFSEILQKQGRSRCETDSSWFGEYCEENIVLLRQVRLESQRLAKKQRELAERIAGLQLKLQMFSAECVGLGMRSVDAGISTSNTLPSESGKRYGASTYSPCDKGFCFEEHEKSNVVMNDSARVEDEYNRVIEIEFENGGRLYVIKALALLDSGSSITFIKKRLVNPALIRKSGQRTLEFTGINNSKLGVVPNVTVSCTLNNVKNQHEIFVVKNDTMPRDAVLGRDFFRKFDLKIIERK